MNAHRNHDSGLQTTRQKLGMVAVLLLVFMILVLGIHSAFKNNTPGIDFYVYWQAGRAFFLENIDPYSDEVTARIQSGIFHNREMQPGDDPMKFNNPPFALIAVLPFLPLSFDWAQAAWMAFNLLCLIVLTYLSFPRAPEWLILSLPFCYQVAFGLILGNFAPLIFLVLVWVLSRLQRQRPLTTLEQVCIGFLLAWASAKPQLVWLYILLVCLLCLQRKAFYVLVSYLGCLGLLWGLMFLVRNDWFSGWFQHIQSFAQFHPSASCRQFFLERLFPFKWQPAASWFLQGLMAALFILAFVLWVRSKISWPMLLGWCSLAIIVIHPVCISYDQIILLLPIFIWAAEPNRRISALVVVCGIGLILPYFFFPAADRYNLPWLVNQMPIVLYLLWMLWLHFQWMHQRKILLRNVR